MHHNIRRTGSLIVLAILLTSLLPFPGTQLAAAAGEEQPAARPVWVPTRNEVVSSAAGAPLAQDDGPWVVRAYYEDVQMVRDLAAWIEPWEVNRDRGYVVLDVDQSGYARLLAMGFRVEIDAVLTAQLRQPNEMLPGQITGIPGYPCYRTVEETFATAQSIVDTYPLLATWVDAGDSWEKVTPGGSPGYDMMVLRLTNSATPGPKPRLFVMSSVHAREYAPAELNTRFAEYLVTNYDVDADITWLLNAHEIHLMFQANPDGRKQAETGLSWRKNTNENYCSPTSTSRGADLNRNFEFEWGCCGGSSGNPCDLTYRGPSPASEPETQVVQDYVRSQFPDQRADDLSAAAPVTTTGIFLDIHSYGNLVLWPWGFTYSAAPNSTALQTLGRKFAYFNGYEPDQAVGLYPTDGATDDFAYGELGLAAYTFEVGTAFFQTCSVFENSIIPDNMPALLYAAKASRTPYLTPAGPDPVGVAVEPSGAMPGNMVTLTATLDDTRFSTVNGTEPAQPIDAAAYYIDVPPWADGATPHAMSAVDGAFNETVEDVTAFVDTTGLNEGRHIIYVRGQDHSGNWGVVSAAFLWVVDPSRSPVIEGYVRDATNRLPLSAVVTAGAYQSTTDPATGYYSVTVNAGSYDVTAAAAGYADSTAAGIIAGDGARVRSNFSLYPFCDVFADDVESGSAGWMAQGSWAITSEAANSPTHAWTDSPGSVYGNNWDYALTSPVIDLTGFTGTELHFWHRYDLEDDYDFGYVDYSTDDGSTWATAISYNGVNQTTWRDATVDLGALDGAASARFRFRLKTDVSVTEDGWHIDDVALRSGGPSCPSAPVAPVAGFVLAEPVIAGTAASFVNLSVGSLPVTYHWDFGDGVGTSAELEPVYTYTTAGTFTATLFVTNSLGSDAFSLPVAVTQPMCEPLALSSLTHDAPVFLGAPVHFTATVSGEAPLTYVWDFGGAGSGTDLIGPKPVYTYDAPGTYTVALTVTDPCETAALTSTVVAVRTRPDAVWERDVYVNGVLTDTFPAAVIAGDVVSVTDRVLITHTGGVTFTFDTGWSESLDLLAWENGDLGETAVTSKTLLWSMENVTPATVYPVTRTFTVLAGLWPTDTIADGLWVEDADPQPPSRVLTFTHLNPAISISPDRMSVRTSPASVTTMTVTITNTGDAPLAWNFSEAPPALWLLTSPSSGSVAPDDSDLATVTLVAPVLTGTYTTTLRVNSNDPGTPVISVPVTLDVRLPFDFRVTPVITSGTGLPGEAVTATFQVENTGLNADVLTVTLQGVSWPVTAPDSVGPLLPDARVPLPIVTTVPVTAQCGGFDAVTLSLTSQGNPIRTRLAFLTTSVETVRAVDVTGDGLARSGDPGQPVTHTAFITNTGNCVDLFRLETSGSWASAAPLAVGPLLPGAGVQVSPTVVVTMTALAGATDVTTLRVISQGNTAVSSTLPLTTTANAIYAMALSPDSLALSTPQGTVAAYTFVLSNTGNATDTFALALLDTTWPSIVVPTSTLVTPGTAVPVAVTVTVPLTVATMATDTGRITAVGTGTAAQSWFTTTANCLEVSGAQFTYSPTQPVGLAPVTVTGTVAGGTVPVRYAWDFGDGSAVVAGQVVTHVFPIDSVIQPYTVTMTATNMCSADVFRQVVAVHPLRVFLPLVIRE